MLAYLLYENVLCNAGVVLHGPCVAVSGPGLIVSIPDRLGFLIELGPLRRGILPTSASTATRRLALPAPSTTLFVPFRFRSGFGSAGSWRGFCLQALRQTICRGSWVPEAITLFLRLGSTLFGLLL